MLKKGIGRLIQIALIPVIGGIVGLALLTLVFLLPTERIIRHVEASLPMLDREERHFSLTPTVEGASLDNYTEALYLNEAMVNTENASLKECVLCGYIFNPIDDTTNPITTLSYAMAMPENKTVTPDNKRFFNGYEVAVKPLLMLTDYAGIRQINLYLSLALSLLLLQGMLRRGLRREILPVIVSVLFLRPLTLALNMTFFGFYVCMLVPCLCFLRLSEEALRQKAWLLFGVTGAATYYFNMNYIQLLSFGVPMLFYFLLVGLPEKPFDVVKTVAFDLFAWLVGCVGMMVFKWIAYAVFLDAGIFREMLESFLFRADVFQGTRLGGIVKNAVTGFGNPFWFALECLFVLGNLVSWVRGGRRLSVSRSALTLLALMLLLVLGRYFILSNHVTIHYWVTYRLFMIPVLAFNLLLTSIGSGNGSKQAEHVYL